VVLKHLIAEIKRLTNPLHSQEIIMKRLLVVDDALFMRKMICGVAAEAGWQVVAEACNGAEAVSLYQQYRPDLVTMDLVMPVMGGLEALRQIRAIDPQAQVVVVTALDQKQSLMDSIRDGAIDFIVKPFERERVLALLAKARGVTNLN
jgi:two-component system, chemotaxis family, chemotaxis protein CheY